MEMSKHVVVTSLVLWYTFCIHIGFCSEEPGINIIVIAPSNVKYCFCLQRITPAMHIGIEKMELPPWIPVNLIPIDSNFPDEISMWTEVRQFIYNNTATANLFLGPVHKYALELLARVSAQKNLVIMSPGGFGVNLGVNKTTDPKFKSLIRVGSTMHKLIGYIQKLVLDEYNYKHIKFISEKHDSEMYFCLEFDRALQYIMNLEKIRRSEKFEFDRYLFPKKYSANDILKTEIGTKFAGKNDKT